MKIPQATKAISIVLGLLFSSVILAESEATAEQSIQKSGIKKPLAEGETLVIIGKVPRPIEDVFGSALVINRKQMDDELVHDINDLVRYQAGIGIENNGSRFGFSGFNIRGVGGNRVAIEVDGIPVADQFSIGSYSNSGRNMLDMDLVQQVEILRGPASSVYGSRAIGGVVSFITRKPNDLIAQTDKDYWLSLKAGYYGVDNSRVLSVNSAFAKESSSFLVSLTDLSSNEMDNNSTLIDPQSNQSQSLLAKWVYDLSPDRTLTLSLDHFNKKTNTDIQSLLGLGRFRSTSLLLGDDESQRNNFSASYEFYKQGQTSWWDGGVIRAFHQSTKTSQLTDENRSSRGTPYAYQRDFYFQQEINGVRANLYKNFQGDTLSHEMGYGIEWSNSQVEELRNGLKTNLNSMVSTNIILSEDFPLRDFPISEIKELGIYFNDQIQIDNSSVSLIPAIRYDHYSLTPKPDAIYLADNPATQVVSISKGHWSPKLGLQQVLSDNSHWFVQYYEGFRAPPFEDANIGLDIPLFNIRAIPNPDLKSETSRGLELGFRFSNRQHKIDWITFITRYKDFIQTKVNLGFDPVSGRVLFQSQNIDRTKIYGSEFKYQFKSKNWLQKDDRLNLFLQAFYSRGEDVKTGLALNNLSPNHLISGIDWQSPSGQWNLGVRASLYAAKSDLDDPNGDLYRSAGYSLYDLIAKYQLSQDLSLSLGLFNLSDHRYWRWDDVRGLQQGDPLLETLSAAGRNASLQLKYHW
ncbi:MAG: TonB-dependent hemoglobin/transferrin/lactoferrin family receptor [Enterobacterales bacterium]|nr:TonB-dependent hemoglobin/transferrin/lactoferrin family receptor [Enterobacterales bacterium]